MDVLSIFLGLIVLGGILYLMRKFLETYYDELLRFFLIIFAIFVIIQLIVVSLIYFELIDYTYTIFEKIIYYNLIWAVPLGLLFGLVRERCTVCKSFETTIDEKILVSKSTGRYHTTGSGDFETSTPIDEHSLPFFKTSKTTFLIPSSYDTDCNSFPPLKYKLLMYS
jgi:hypothetical protein